MFFLSYYCILKFLFYERCSAGGGTLKFMSYGKAKLSRLYECCVLHVITKLFGCTLFPLQATMQDPGLRLRATVQLTVGLVVLKSVFSCGTWFP